MCVSVPVVLLLLLFKDYAVPLKRDVIVNFTTQALDTPTLQGLSFTARPGELLAVVGPVGAGKVSFLFRLVFRLAHWELLT